MAQDLNDIIEHLNIFERLADAADLLKLTCRIRKAHMDSLQWISQNTGMLHKKVEGVAQVFQGCPHKEQECNVGIAFD